MPKEANKKQSKDKKHFMKDFKAEIKRVIWPTPKQLLNNTVAVIVIVLITAVIVFALDIVFESMNKYGIDQLKAIVDTTNEVTTDTNQLISIDNVENSNTIEENATDSETTVDESENGADSTNTENTNNVE